MGCDAFVLFRILCVLSPVGCRVQTGKAILDEQPLDAHFTRSFYKHMRIGTSLVFGSRCVTVSANRCLRLCVCDCPLALCIHPRRPCGVTLGCLLCAVVGRAHSWWQQH